MSAVRLIGVLTALVLLWQTAAHPQRQTETFFDLEEASIADLQRRLADGRETARSLTKKYLARIDALDRHGPALRSVIEANPDALRIAEGLDRERRNGRLRGPLHGIPIVRPGRDASAQGCLRRVSTARGGGRDSRQNELERVGEFSFDTLFEWVECPRWPDP
jgi:hypothetical protein